MELTWKYNYLYQFLLSSLCILYLFLFIPDPPYMSLTWLDLPTSRKARRRRRADQTQKKVVWRRPCLSHNFQQSWYSPTHQMKARWHIFEKHISCYVSLLLFLIKMLLTKWSRVINSRPTFCSRLSRIGWCRSSVWSNRQLRHLICDRSYRMLDKWAVEGRC